MPLVPTLARLKSACVCDVILRRVAEFMVDSVVRLKSACVCDVILRRVAEFMVDSVVRLKSACVWSNGMSLERPRPY
jgi:hypothetical protein